MTAVRTQWAEVKRRSGAHGCVECGRCVAVCPMAEMYRDFSIDLSPRGIIKKALASEGIVRDPAIWYCTECNAGTDICPQGVSCRDLIRGLRTLARSEPGLCQARTCRCCGEPFVALPVEAFLQDRLQAEPRNVRDLLQICPVCRRAVYLQRNT